MSIPALSANWPGRDAESLLWIASYPRSGNTFTRILLANYFSDDESPYDLNKLSEFIPSDTTGRLWKSYSEEMAAPSTLKRTWEARPGFIRHCRKTLSSWAFPALKTHTANVEVSGQRGFEFRKTDRAIYIVRHPLDVVLSYADFNGRDTNQAVEMMTTSGLCVFTDHHGGAYEVRGSWFEHVQSWLMAPRCPLLLIRYEELRGNTERALRDILDFIGTPVSPDRVSRAVEASRFDNVRKQNSLHGFIEAPKTLTSGNFFRKGEALQWLRELDPEQAYRLADSCEPIMSKLGYTHPRDVYFDGRNALQPIHLQG